MYQLATVSKADIKKLRIQSQKEIVERWGEKLIPIEAYELLKKETENFTKESEIAH